MSDLEAIDRLDAALRAVAVTRTNFSSESIPMIRDSMNDRRRASAEAETAAAGVPVVEDVARAESGAAVPVRIYQGASAPAPAVIYCHAGGFALGNLDTDHRQCLELARRGQCSVVSVDYRLAPEHPFPAGLDDAITVLQWTVTHAARLGIDADRLAVAGSSSGGALAACLTHRAADGLLPPIAFQLLHQPVLDDRPTASMLEFRGTPAFDGEAAELMWRHYLAGQPASPDAVPARRAVFNGLPPTLITCAEIDPFRDEAVEYALRLLRAGISTELHVFPGACHGFDSLLPEWSTTQRLFALQGNALSTAFREG
ncbi:Carboxylesterase NlhH [Mycobacterium basiliense]|uniref:Carboxylesterase NlhH n=1 Tax=Mycobacterium basiliense TaxID=2094119 RepID=A0A447G8I8_9MYCO|nr:alpha/beta hydrolase [Mycobacterium basiliense]VDM86789.1 Carboxylesterase NlhH [Mycobacterium basiliense]